MLSEEDMADPSPPEASLLTEAHLSEEATLLEPQPPIPSELPPPPTSQKPQWLQADISEEASRLAKQPPQPPMDIDFYMEFINQLIIVYYLL